MTETCCFDLTLKNIHLQYHMSCVFVYPPNHLVCHQYFVHPYAKQFCTNQKGDLEAFPTFHLSRCRLEQKLHSAVHPDNFVADPLGALSVRSLS